MDGRAAGPRTDACKARLTSSLTHLIVTRTNSIVLPYAGV
jgi:hypothetical protein